MKYFFDCEFIEGFRKPLFGKRHHFIDLISIGIVSEDGREFKAISSEYDYKDADEWVKANVITPLYISTVHGDARNQMTVENFHKVFGSTIDQIRYSLFCFFFPGATSEWIGSSDELWKAEKTEKVELFGYYSAYDHVLLCSIFGRMIDLPNGVPMYTMDLKQMMIERGLDTEWKRVVCPDPQDEHDALADAKWNQKLYDAILKESAAINVNQDIK